MAVHRVAQQRVRTAVSRLAHDVLVTLAVVLAINAQRGKGGRRGDLGVGLHLRSSTPGWGVKQLNTVFTHGVNTVFSPGA